MDSITVITPVYVNVPARLGYFISTIESFQRCARFSGEIIHYVMDDRSPLHSEDVHAFCDQMGLHYLHSGSIKRSCFHDVFAAMVEQVETEFCIYLEGDHYFYLPYDFITPAIRLYRLVPGLHQIYFRAPLTLEHFTRRGTDLITYDRTVLHAVRIDENNVGWIGRGKGHESFSLMPSLFRTETLRQKVVHRPRISGGPFELEITLAREWEYQYLTGYLNAQAFCYHIGNAGKSGPGGFLDIGDAEYEAVWSQKILI